MKRSIPLPLLAVLMLAACGSDPALHALDNNEQASTLAEPVSAQDEIGAAGAAKIEQQAATDSNALVPETTVAAPASTNAPSAAAPTMRSKALAIAPWPCPMPVPPQPSPEGEQYGHDPAQPVQLAQQNPVSTFSIDVDTAGYANVRRLLGDGMLPPRDAVRIEEMVNYFRYDYRGPSSRQQPFRVTAEMAPAPWDGGKQLLSIGLKGYELERQQLPPANLVFLIDVSGSMQSPDKLPLLKQALAGMVGHLRDCDRISIVVYAGASGLVLPATPGNRQQQILAALDALEAGGSTNGADGIRLAYRVAEATFSRRGINRVILATDGDFNVGTTDFEALMQLVAQKRAGGVELSVLGFGRGNINDRLMEQLADRGNGNYAYIDSLAEGEKVLIEQASGTLATIARDVKIQMEFNPAVVREYRLIGYNNRQLKREDFNNDRVDAGEIGAGHTVTALYELTLVGGKGSIDPLRYGAQAAAGKGNELGFLKLRYKQSQGSSSQLLSYPLPRNMGKTLAATSDRFRFAAAVAAFGELLRGGQYAGNFDYRRVQQLAQGALGSDRDGRRHEFLQLVAQAEHLAAPTPRQPLPVEPQDGLIIQ